MDNVIEAPAAAADLDHIKPGDLMSFTYWGKVTEIDSETSRLYLENVDTGEEFSVCGKSLIEDSQSADIYDHIEIRPRRQIVDILIHSKRLPFTVSFIKKNGENRILKGRVICVREVNQGYIDVEDLEVDDSENRHRQVDTRTIQYVIVSGTKYQVK